MKELLLKVRVQPSVFKAPPLPTVPAPPLARLLAKLELLIVATTPNSRSIAPPLPTTVPLLPIAWLPVKVQLETLSVELYCWPGRNPKLSMAPPKLPSKKLELPPPVALLPVKLEFETVAVPRFRRAPPKESFPGLAAATLLVSRLWVIPRLAPTSLAIPPPLAASGVVLSPLPPTASLPISVHWLIVNVPKLSIPAPWPANPLAIFS